MIGIDMTYNLPNDTLHNALIQSEQDLLNSEKIKFSFDRKWTSNFPEKPGVYAIFDKSKLLYIGESANLKERMKELKRTYNHSFRKKLGGIHFNGKIGKNKKYSDKIEQMMNEFYTKNVYLSFIEVNFGRIEIESFLIDKFNDKILNSKKKRKGK